MTTSIFTTKFAHCPNCGHVLSGAIPMEAKAVVPGEGDISACFKCRTILTFNADLTLRLCTREEYDTLSAEHQILFAKLGARLKEL